MSQMIARSLDCKHTDIYWSLATNEDGWRCTCGHKPGEPPGFSPQLDRELLAFKVSAILHDLHDADVIYASNADMGEALTNQVETQCRRLGWYDQYTIVKLLLDAVQARHAKYWREISKGILAGTDPRNRCHCGKLANCSTGEKYFCGEHSAWGEPF